MLAESAGSRDNRKKFNDTFGPKPSIFSGIWRVYHPKTVIEFRAAEIGVQWSIPAGEPSFSDDFEGTELDPFWETHEESGYVMFPSSTRAHSGTQAVQFTSTNTSQYKNIWLHHTFSQPGYGRASVWAYDTAAGSNNSNYSWLSVYSADSECIGYIATDDYRGDLYRVVYPGSEDYYTSVERTTGWHHLSIEVTPTAVIFEIDGDDVFEWIGDAETIGQVRFGTQAPPWRPEWTFFFDDFEFVSYPQVPPSVPVTVGVEDGRGGLDTQSFTIDVLESGPGEIHGTKFNDLNGDTIKTSGEAGLEGWTIYLDQNQNGQRDADEKWTTTDATGNYSFTSLPPGTYYVAEEQQTGWVQTSPPGGVRVVTIPDVPGAGTPTEVATAEPAFEVTVLAEVENAGGAGIRPRRQLVRERSVRSRPLSNERC